MEDWRPLQQEKVRFRSSGKALPEIWLRGLPDFMPGSVWLAGSGPGDAGLLTLLTVHGLKHSDVVVYDALVSEDILSLRRSSAEIIYAGKRGGKASVRQADISTRLVELAREGKRVLRLKGGDPFIFGRGGEEATVLAAAGVSFRIIPGVSSSIAAAGYSGIPLTHRDFNHVVSFVTGHQADVIDWAALSRASPVIVVYMGLRQIGVIASALMAAGRSGETGVAIITHATMLEQRVIVSVLSEVEVRAQSVSPPALIIIGDIVRYHRTLDWFSSWQVGLEGVE